MAITMKNLNDRTSALEGKAATTPITMKGLSDRLDNIEATAKKWEETTFTIKHLTDVSNNVTLSLPQNIKNIYSGSKQMWIVSGTVSYRQSGSQYTDSASNGKVSLDNNNLYYKYGIAGAKAYDDITIRLVIYK